MEEDKCADCKQPVIGDYMLLDEVWESIARPDEMLHISCTEKRLGRKLVKSDFSNVPLNYIFGHLPWDERVDL